MSKRFLLTLILGGVTALVLSGCGADADIDAKDDDGWTPLHWAASKNSLDVARLLIEHGAEVDARDKNGATPLFWAASANSPDLARLLIKHGAEVDARDKTGKTPLRYAASQSNSLEVARLLIDRGAEVDARSKTGHTPLYGAILDGPKWQYGSHSIVARMLADRRGGVTG